MKRYLDPKADLTFKRVFGEHKELLISLLNALLPFKPGKEIVCIEYLLPEMVPDTPGKKDSIVDVMCTDTDDRRFIVEMQMYWTSAFKYRALFNTAKAVSQQLDAGAHYGKLKPVYTLSLVNDIAFPNTERFYHHYLPTEQTDTTQVIDGFDMIFVELPKFAAWQAKHGHESDPIVGDTIIISEQKFKRLAVLWYRFLTEINEHTVEVDEALMADTSVRTAIDLVEQSAFTVSERLTYDRYWDLVSRERTALDEAYDRGEAIGLEKGLAEGEANALHKTAQKMKAMGLAPAVIADATGIPVSEVTQL